jgi:hypothetical protein
MGKENGQVQDLFIRDFPASVLQALDADAKRCKRSRGRQIEGIIAAYLGLEDVDLLDIEAARNKLNNEIETLVSKPERKKIIPASPNRRRKEK